MKRIVALLLLLTLASAASGQDFEKGVRAYERRDCAEAEQELRPLAERGHADAQYFLGKAHAYCWGVPSLPLAGAAKWYRMAAEQGHADAQYWLGHAYMDGGGGITKDYEKAMKWWRKAAEQGHAKAMFTLGELSYRCQTEGGFACGDLYPPDDVFGPPVPLYPEYTKAEKWFQLAAEHGHLRSQAAIATMYLEGRGVPQDYVLAHMWFNLAAAQAKEISQNLPPGLYGLTLAIEAGPGRGALVKARDAVAAKMTPDQIAEAQRLARDWKPKK